MYKSYLLLITVLLASLVGASGVFAQSNAETAARQAQIDADLAASNLQDTRRREREQANTQNTDTAEIQQQNAQIRQDARQIGRAEAEEQDAEDAED